MIYPEFYPVDSVIHPLNNLVLAFLSYNPALYLHCFCGRIIGPRSLQENDALELANQSLHYIAINISHINNNYH